MRIFLFLEQHGRSTGLKIVLGPAFPLSTNPSVQNDVTVEVVVMQCTVKIFDANPQFRTKGRTVQEDSGCGSSDSGCACVCDICRRAQEYGYRAFDRRSRSREHDVGVFGITIVIGGTVPRGHASAVLGTFYAS